jgi:hypothetical protein
VIRGHHISKGIWTPTVGETLQLSREPSNPYDINAIAVLKNGNTVGHVPRSISTILSLFILEGGQLFCEITGHRKYGVGLEVCLCYLDVLKIPQNCTVEIT